MSLIKNVVVNTRRNDSVLSFEPSALSLVKPASATSHQEPHAAKLTEPVTPADRCTAAQTVASSTVPLLIVLPACDCMNVHDH